MCHEVSDGHDAVRRKATGWVSKPIKMTNQPASLSIPWMPRSAERVRARVRGNRKTQKFLSSVFQEQKAGDYPQDGQHSSSSQVRFIVMMSSLS